MLSDWCGVQPELGAGDVAVVLDGTTEVRDSPARLDSFGVDEEYRRVVGRECGGFGMSGGSKVAASSGDIGLGISGHSETDELRTIG